jgi:hypothetical protein
MPRQQYLCALMALLASPEEAIVTRALRLFQSSLSALPAGEASDALQFCDQACLIPAAKHDFGQSRVVLGRYSGRCVHTQKLHCIGNSFALPQTSQPCIFL